MQLETGAGRQTRATYPLLLITAIAGGIAAGCATGAASPGQLPRVPVAAVLPHSQFEDPRSTAFGYVVLTAIPDEASRPRYSRFCHAVLDRMLASARFPEMPDAARLPTYWPITTTEVPLECGS